MKVLDQFQQGSIEWMQARVGKITMSHAKDLLTKGRGKTRESYLLDVAAERLSGEPIEGYHGLDMERGNFLESWAVQAFEAATKLRVKTIGFVLHDDERIGCSPDGFVIGDDAGIEIKSPKPRQHIRNVYGKGIDDYRHQCQGNMWVCNRKYWYIVSFCPWVQDIPLYIKRIQRDDSMIEDLEKSATEAANTVDEIEQQVRAVELRPGVREISDKARDAWTNAIAENSEVIL